MADGREDELIEEVQNCPDLWDVSSAAYKDTCSKGQISTGIPFRPNLSIIPALSVSSPAINIQQEQDKGGDSSWVPLHFIGHFANLVCVVIWREFDVWTHKFANFLKFANTSSQT